MLNLHRETADNIVAIGKNVTPDGGDGDKKMPALDDEEIAKAISASENNMLDRLLEKEMDGDEEMQAFKSRHLLPASVAQSMSVDNAIHRWLQGKTVRQMAANDSQDGSRKMLPASTAQGMSFDFLFKILNSTFEQTQYIGFI